MYKGYDSISQWALAELEKRKQERMNLKFIEEGHKYECDKGIKWKSVTSVTKLLEEPFDADKQAVRSSKNSKSKWYKMDPEEIKAIWKKTNTVAIDLGNWYHRQREEQICGIDTLDREGSACSIVKPIIQDSIKYAPDQKLKNNSIYPEHFVYLESAGICGQSDLVEVRDNKVYITDYKTNKHLTTEGFVSWDGTTKKLLAPVSHLDDCKLSIYNIQLSLYMYIILKHNPQLKFGKLTINHILFKEVDRDKYDNPIYDRDSNNEPIVDQVIKYDMDYLKDEVILILNHLKTN